MPTNNPEYQKSYGAKHYAANRQKYIDQAAALKEQLRADVRAVKSVPCADCRSSYPYYVMEFDHRPGEEKLGAVARMVANGQRKKVFEEIKKCDVVCANCHRERTHQRASVV